MDQPFAARQLFTVTAPSPSEGRSSVGSFDDARAVFEREYLIRLLQETRHNVSRAAIIAGMTRQNLYRLIRRHAVPLLR